MKNGITTTVGTLRGDLIPTYHVNWYTYSDDGEQKMLGLDQIVEAFYGKRVELLESPNDTSYVLDVSKKVSLEAYDANSLQECVRHGGLECYYLGILMQYLVSRDVLPAGHYAIRVSW